MLSRWSRRQAERIAASAEQLAAEPIPARARRVRDLDQHYLAVPPYGAVFYALENDQLRVLAVVDARRQLAAR
jgi:hypothetical protein